MIFEYLTFLMSEPEQIYFYNIIIKMQKLLMIKICSRDHINLNYKGHYTKASTKGFTPLRCSRLSIKIYIETPHECFVAKKF